MALTLEHKEQIAELVRDRKDILFGTYSPTVTKTAKTKSWNEIFNIVVAHGAPIPNVQHLRKVPGSQPITVFLLSLSLWS